MAAQRFFKDTLEGKRLDWRTRDHHWCSDNLRKQAYRLKDRATRQELRAEALTVDVFDSEWTPDTEAEMVDLATAHLVHCSCPDCQREDYFEALFLHTADQAQRVWVAEMTMLGYIVTYRSGRAPREQWVFITGE